MRLKTNSCFVMAMIAAASMQMASAGAAEPGYGILAYPERPVEIPLSNRDVNRIVCDAGAIEDYKFSGEKGILMEASGQDAYVKFQIMEVGEARQYVTVRSEFFVKCGGATYTLFAQPQDIPAQTVFLGGGETRAEKANVALFNPLSDEERAISITHSVLRDDPPSSFSVRLLDEPYRAGAIPGADVRRRRHVHAEGTGFSAAEFLVRAARPVRLEETMFLRRRFGASIYAVTLEKPELEAGEVGRVVIVYRGAAQ